MKFGGGVPLLVGSLPLEYETVRKSTGLFGVTFCVWVWALCGVGVYVCVHIWVYVSFYRTVAVCVYYMDMCVCHCV